MCEQLCEQTIRNQCGNQAGDPDTEQQPAADILQEVAKGIA